MDASLPTLHVQLLGGFRLVYGDSIVTGLKTTRLQSLLAYLILHRNIPQSRQRLAFLFWPDTSEEQARNNLRNLLHFLRRALPDSEKFLLADTQTLQWNPQAYIAFDVDQFTQAVTQSSSRLELQQAIQFYSGDLLPDCYDDWVQLEREQLRERFIGALEQLIQSLENEREYSLAISYAQRLLQTEPLREETYRQLMQLYAANGERAKALHTYHSCVTLFKRELEVEPGSDIEMLYLRLLKNEGQRSLPRLAGTPPLISREREWTILQSVWHSVAKGESHFVLITGETGIGKTRLAEEMIDWAERQGIATATAHCFAAEGELSYAPVIAWLRSRPLPALEEVWLSEIARLFPEVLVEHPQLTLPLPLTENWQRMRLFKAIALALLRERSELILLIEDLQWCDHDTIEWLAYLLQAHAEISPATRLLLVGTLRIGETTINHSLDDLRMDLHHANQMTDIELEALNESETIALVGVVIGQPINTKWGSKLYRETEGNALFIVEMARLLQGKEIEDDPGYFAIPPKVQEVIQARLSHFSREARELAEIAAVIGRQFTFPVLKKAAGGTEEHLVHSLDELWRGRIVREHSKTAYDFSHEKIRQVVYEQMSGARKRFCHRKVAEALEKLYINNLETVSAQLAAHYEQADEVEKALHYYHHAAQVSQRLYANQQTIQFLQRGLQLLEQRGVFEPPAEAMEKVVCQHHELLGDVLGRIGNYDESRAQYEHVLELVRGRDPFWEARLHRKIGNDFREQVLYDQAVSAYQEAEACIGQPPQENADAWWWEWIELQLDQSLVYFYLSKQEEVVQIVERLGRAIDQHGTIPERGRYYRRLVVIKFRQERFVVDDEIIRLSRKALEIIEESDDLVETASAHFGLGLALLLSGNLDEAEDQIQVAIKVTEKTGQDLLSQCFAYLAVIQRKRHNVQAALEHARHVLEITTQKKDPIYVAIAKSTFAWAAWRQNQFAEAEREAKQSLAIWENLPDAFAFRWIALWPLLASTLTQDRITESIDAVRELFGPYQQPPPPELTEILLAALQAGDKGQIAEARLSLHQAIELAITFGYL